MIKEKLCYVSSDFRGDLNKTKLCARQISSSITANLLLDHNVRRGRANTIKREYVLPDNVTTTEGYILVRLLIFSYIRKEIILILTRLFRHSMRRRHLPNAKRILIFRLWWWTMRESVFLKFFSTRAILDWINAGSLKPLLVPSAALPQSFTLHFFPTFSYLAAAASSKDFSSDCMFILSCCCLHYEVANFSSLSDLPNFDLWPLLT